METMPNLNYCAAVFTTFLAVVVVDEELLELLEGAV